MNTRTRATFVALCLATVLLGTGVGAVAAIVSVPWEQFAQFRNDDERRCGYQKAVLRTPNDGTSATGHVRYEKHQPCEPGAAPPGYIGVTEYLQNGNGMVCDQRGWVYNSNSVNSIDVSTQDGNGNCDNWNWLRANALGRVYNHYTQSYETAYLYVRTPYYGQD